MAHLIRSSTPAVEVYGNMPLIEPLETREERRIEELVIAVDASMSTSGKLVRRFRSGSRRGPSGWYLEEPDLERAAGAAAEALPIECDWDELPRT